MKEKIVLFTENVTALREQVTEYTRGLKYDIHILKSAKIEEFKEPETVTAIISDNAEMLAKSAGIFPNLRCRIAVTPKKPEDFEGQNSFHIRPNFSNAVSEYALGMMLALSRKIVLQDREARTGQFTGSHAEQLMGKTLGIIYLDEMTTDTAKIAGDFGLNVLCMVKDGIKKAFIEEYGIAVSTSLTDVLRNSDFLIVNSSDSTDKGLISFKEITSLKKNAYVIDISNMDVIDPFALLKALTKGDVAGAAFDITDKTRVTDDLIKNAKVILTYNNVKSTKDAHINALTDALDLAVQKLKIPAPKPEIKEQEVKA